MAITTARVCSTDIRCETCGNVRTVDQRWARKWREGQIPGTCASCRGGSGTRVVRDKDIGFWLKAYGVKIPRGAKARDVLTASGMPPELAEFARSVFPPP